MPRVVMMRNPKPRVVRNAPGAPQEWGLFVWRGENRYYWDERLDGKTYKHESVADKAAKRRNARGEHGGMIVARPRSLIHETRMTPNPPRQLVERYKGVAIYYDGGRYDADIVSATGGNIVKPRMNTLASARRFVGFALKRGAVPREQWRPAVNPQPRRRVKANPPASRVVCTLSTRAVELRYIHAEDKGQPYKHAFARGVSVQLLSDGSVRLVRPDGRPLWKDFQ